MWRIRESVERFVGSEDGLTVTEYGILLALVGIVAVAAVKLLGPTLVAMFQGGADAVSSASP